MALRELELNIFEKKQGKWFDIILYFLIGIMLLLLLFFNFFSLCGIIGPSMDDTLFDGQNVLLINTKNAGRGDIIVFKEGDRLLIKRVIGVENDRLAFAVDGEGNAAVYINKGEGNTFSKLNEDYIFEPMKGAWINPGGVFVFPCVELMPSLSIDDEKYVIDVEKDCYFVMGDNREVSYDSRSFGTIKKATLYGKTVLKLQKNSFLERVLLLLYGEVPTE